MNRFRCLLRMRLTPRNNHGCLTASGTGIAICSGQGASFFAIASTSEDISQPSIGVVVFARERHRGLEYCRSLNRSLARAITALAAADTSPTGTRNPRESSTTSRIPLGRSETTGTSPCPIASSNPKGSSLVIGQQDESRPELRVWRRPGRKPARP
jgi:hypothetical protein